MRIEWYCEASGQWHYPQLIVDCRQRVSESSNFIVLGLVRTHASRCSASVDCSSDRFFFDSEMDRYGLGPKYLCHCYRSAPVVWLVSSESGLFNWARLNRRGRPSGLSVRLGARGRCFPVARPPKTGTSNAIRRQI
jgi:hypothetical protein